MAHDVVDGPNTGGGDADERTPKRRKTEARLLDAALEQLERNGVLAGLNMQAVAEEAGVNRGLIHHYFGSRQALLRAALSRAQSLTREHYLPHLRTLSARERGPWLWDHFSADYARMIMLLALDSAEGVEVVIDFADDLAMAEAEQAAGQWEGDVDMTAMLVAWNVFTLGWFVLREPIAEQLDLDVGDLDGRVKGFFERLFNEVLADPVA